MKTENYDSKSDLLSWNTAYRGYNLLVAGLVTYQYINNSEALGIEYLPDIAIHAFEAIAPGTFNQAAEIANTIRGVQAGIGFFSGESSIPRAANFVDMFNHGMNLCHRIAQ